MSEQTVEAWRIATGDFIDAVSQMPDWSVASACPGWTISDLVAHTADLEAVLAEDPRPAHTPDWERLPHVANDFGRFIEVGVDARRGSSRDELLDELRQAHARAQQRVLAMAPTDPIPWVRGDTPRDEVLKMRTFDVWMHEQDARVFTDMPGNLDGPGAQRALERLAAGLPKLWAKSAPPGSCLHLRITEPGLSSEYWISVDADGRAAFVDAGDATATITMPWLTFVMLGGGRSTPVTSHVEIDGDVELGRAFIGRMAVTP